MLNLKLELQPLSDINWIFLQWILQRIVGRNRVLVVPGKAFDMEGCFRIGYAFDKTHLITGLIKYQSIWINWNKLRLMDKGTKACPLFLVPTLGFIDQTISI